MMYANNIAACIKINNKILRENKDRVIIPFGSEYSILYKNMNSVRTIFTVTIDGEDAVGRIVCNANSTVELERFLKNGNLSAGNRFKFIERSRVIEKYRGAKIDDGLIRIESWKEIVSSFAVRPQTSFYNSHYDTCYPIGTSGSTYTSGSGITGQSVNCDTMRAIRHAEPINETGITVPGSESHQQFHYVNEFTTEGQSTVIVFDLVGQVGKLRATRPLTVKTKLECQSCGLKNKSLNQFCSRCGTSLQVFA